jgi:hypothetical protein
VKDSKSFMWGQPRGGCPHMNFFAQAELNAPFYPRKMPAQSTWHRWCPRTAVPDCRKLLLLQFL